MEPGSGRVPSGRMEAGSGNRESGIESQVPNPESRIPSPESIRPQAGTRPNPRRLGVIGTFVWDKIYGRDTRSAPVEEWGGITYALSGLDAALPPDWEIVPIMKIGEDLAARGREYLAGLRRLAPDPALVEVPYASNRVELRYQTSERRCERLTGGVPGWTWLGLKPLLNGLDALYINFISGFELDLETAQLLRQHFRGPIYCDLHSLVLAVQSDGMRAPQPLPDVPAWCRCFDLLQVNEEELSMMAPDPLALAATALASGIRCLTVTLGSRGVAYFAAADFERISDLSSPRTFGASTGPIRTELAPAPRVHNASDPTGCGDVWGATYFSRLLAGDNLGDAIRVALQAAARNVEHRGATGLSRHLRGELSLR